MKKISGSYSCIMYKASNLITTIIKIVNVIEK